MSRVSGQPTGEALQSTITQLVEKLRAVAGLRGKAAVKATKEARAALRSLGLHLGPAALGALTLLRECERSGVFADLHFTRDDLVRAIARAQDTGGVESKLRVLGQDAHAEALDAREVLALMVMHLRRARTAIVQNPAARQDTRDLVRDAGAQLEGVFTERKGYVKGRRVAGAEARDAAIALDEAHARLAEYESKDDVVNAQKDLKIQYLSGEPLRPDDMSRVAGAPRAGRRRPDEGTEPAATKPKARRTRTR